MSIDTTAQVFGVTHDAPIFLKDVISQLDLTGLADSQISPIKSMSSNARIVNMDLIDNHVPFFAFFVQFQPTLENGDKCQYILLDHQPNNLDRIPCILLYGKEQDKIQRTEISIPVIPSWFTLIFGIEAAEA